MKDDMKNVKLTLTSLTFTPIKKRVFHPCAPFMVNGVQIRCENGKWFYRYLDDNLVSREERSKRSTQITKYLKNEGIWNAYFSHWEKIPNPKPIKCV